MRDDTINVALHVHAETSNTNIIGYSLVVDATLTMPAQTNPGFTLLLALENSSAVNADL